MGSASRLQGGNQATKANSFKVSVLGRLMVFSVLLFWVLRPHPVFQVLWQVQLLGRFLDFLRLWITRWMVLLLGAPPAVTPNAVSGWRQCRLRLRCRLPWWPAACALSVDEGGRCFENTGEYHVHELHDAVSSAGIAGPKASARSRSVKMSRDSARLRRAGGRRTFSSSLSRRFARGAEAYGSLDSFESSFVCVDPVTTRVQRVTAALHGHHIACGTHLSQNSYSVHDACGVWNSENSRGDTEVGGQHFCVHGETKSLSMCTRTRVRRPAVEIFKVA